MHVYIHIHAVMSQAGEIHIPLGFGSSMRNQLTGARLGVYDPKVREGLVSVAMSS